MERFRKKIRVGVSVGDINGIGMEVIFKTFMDKRMLEFCTPVIFGSTKEASYHKKVNEIKNFSFNINSFIFLLGNYVDLTVFSIETFVS